MFCGYKKRDNGILVRFLLCEMAHNGFGNEPLRDAEGDEKGRDNGNYPRGMLPPKAL